MNEKPPVGASSPDTKETPSEAAARAAFDKWEEKGRIERTEEAASSTKKLPEDHPFKHIEIEEENKNSTPETKNGGSAKIVQTFETLVPAAERTASTPTPEKPAAPEVTPAVATKEKTSLEEAKEAYESKLRQQMQEEADKRKEKRIYRMLSARRDLREGGFSAKGEKKNKDLERARKIFLDQKETAIHNEVETFREGLKKRGKYTPEAIEKSVALERHRLSLLAAAENYQRRKEIGTEVLPPREQSIIGRALRNWKEQTDKHPWKRYALAAGLSTLGAGAMLTAGLVTIPAGAAVAGLWLSPRIIGAMASVGIGAYLSEKIRTKRFEKKEAKFSKKEISFDKEGPYRKLEDVDKDFLALQKKKGLYDYRTLQMSMAAALTTGVAIGGISSAAANQMVALDAASILAGRGGLEEDAARIVSDLREGRLGDALEHTKGALNTSPLQSKAATNWNEGIPETSEKMKGLTTEHLGEGMENFEDNLPEEARRAPSNTESMPDDYMKERVVSSSPETEFKRGSDGPRLNEYPESPDEMEKWPEAVPGEPRPDEPQFPARTIGRVIGESPEPRENAAPIVGDYVPTEKPTEPVIHKVTRGENVWKILTKEAKTRGLLENLSGGKETYFIDSLKDKLAALTPDEVRKLGISSGDINKIKIGETIDLTKIFEDKSSIETSQYQASRLNAGDIASIEKNNAAIAEWKKANPGAALNDNVIDSIIRKPRGVTSSELPGSPEPLPEVEVGNDNAPTPAQVETMNKMAADNAVSELVEANLGSKSSWIPWFNQKGTESSAWMNGQRLSVKEILGTQRGSAREIGLTEADLFKLQNLTRSVMTSFGVEPASAAETLKKFIYRAVTNPSSTPEAVKELIGKAIGAKAA